MTNAYLSLNKSINLVCLFALILFAILLMVHPARADYTPITSYGAVCNGTTDDSAAYISSLSALGYAYVPIGATPCYVNPASGIGISLGQNQFITGPGTTLFGKNQTNGFLLNGNGAVVKNTNINCGEVPSPGVQKYCVRGTNVDGATVDHVNFSGSSSVALFFQCDYNGSTPAPGRNPIATNNVFQGKDAIVGIGIFWEGCTGGLVQGNRFSDLGGAGTISFRSWFSSGEISGNSFYTPDVGNTVTATAGQTVFNFTASETGGQRFAMQLDGVPTYIDGTTWVKSGTDPNWILTGPPQAAGVKVRLLVWRAAEQININSGSGVYGNSLGPKASGSGIMISGNIIDGSGDGGIDLTCDLTWTGTTWSETGCASALDLPGNITIVGNTVRNTAAPSIISFFGTRGVNISNNVLSAAALGSSGASNPQQMAFIDLTYSGFVSEDSYARIGYNLLDNSTNTAQYGIAIAGNNAIDTGTTNKQIEIAQQGYVRCCGGTLPTPYYFKASTTQLSSGINLAGVPEVPWPQQPNVDYTWSGTPTLPKTDDYWYYNQATGLSPGISQVTSSIQGGKYAMQTVCGGGINFVPKSESPNSGYAYGNVVHFKVSAKAENPGGTSSTASYIQIVGATGSTYRPASQPVYIENSGTWKNYDVSAAIQGTDRLLYGTIAAPAGSCVTAHVQQPAFYVQQIDAQ
ncbi:MAG TPA: hypothetical protein VJ750_05995 [Rhizomicrobium sp.]|nr:hypothetical protein [Rhizomicrobium sp.]